MLTVITGVPRQAGCANCARGVTPLHNGAEEYNFFLAVIFPDNEMNVMPYNRVVKDLNGHIVAEFISAIARKFEITPVKLPLVPVRRHQFGMFLAGTWYELMPKERLVDENDAVARLDVSILQDNLLNPILGIRNPRSDQRIHFVGGIRGVEELARLVNSGEYQVAFSLYPTSIRELMELADAGKIMPPKSTWFEPKLQERTVRAFPQVAPGRDLSAQLKIPHASIRTRRRGDSVIGIRGALNRRRCILTTIPLYPSLRSRFRRSLQEVGIATCFRYLHCALSGLACRSGRQKCYPVPRRRPF